MRSIVWPTDSRRRTAPAAFSPASRTGECLGDPFVERQRLLPLVFELLAQGQLHPRLRRFAGRSRVLLDKAAERIEVPFLDLGEVGIGRLADDVFGADRLEIGVGLQTRRRNRRSRARSFAVV